MYCPQKTIRGQRLSIRAQRKTMYCSQKTIRGQRQTICGFLKTTNPILLCAIGFRAHGVLGAEFSKETANPGSGQVQRRNVRPGEGNGRSMQ